MPTDPHPHQEFRSADVKSAREKLQLRRNQNGAEQPFQRNEIFRKLILNFRRSRRRPNDSTTQQDTEFGSGYQPSVGTLIRTA
jgi:hypothetical protein